MTSESGIRLDKWLWYARFFKTRTLASKAVGGGHMRVNRHPIAKPGFTVRPGDVLTFAQGPVVRIIEVIACGSRRGPAPEARTLYHDLDPPQLRRKTEPSAPAAGQRDAGAGRPTKKERRALDRLRTDDTLETEDR